MKEIMKKLLEVFLSLSFLITMAFGICGLILEPDGQLQYGDLFAPSAMALLCTLPALLTIVPDQMTTRQIAVRKALQLFLEECIVLSVMHFVFHKFSSVGAALTVAVSVLVVFAGVYLLDWVRNCMEAEKLNRILEQMQKEEKQPYQKER